DVQQLATRIEEDPSKLHRLHAECQGKPSVAPILEIERDEREFRPTLQFEKRLRTRAFAGISAAGFDRHEAAREKTFPVGETLQEWKLFPALAQQNFRRFQRVP